MSQQHSSQKFQNKPASGDREPEEPPKRQESDSQSDGDSGFFNRGEENQGDFEAPSRKKRKAKIIKKRKKRGQTTKKQTQQKKKMQYLKAASQNAMKIIEEMRSCYEKDQRLYEQKKRASHKLVYANKLEKELRNVYVCQQFLQKNGLQYFEAWIRRLPDGTQSPLTLRKKVLSIILDLNINEEHVDKALELKKLIQRGKRCPHTKDLCEAIINKWGDGNLM